MMAEAGEHELEFEASATAPVLRTVITPPSCGAVGKLVEKAMSLGLELAMASDELINLIVIGTTVLARPCPTFWPNSVATLNGAVATL